MLEEFLYRPAGRDRVHQPADALLDGEEFAFDRGAPLHRHALALTPEGDRASDGVADEIVVEASADRIEKLTTLAALRFVLASALAGAYTAAEVSKAPYVSNPTGELMQDLSLVSARAPPAVHTIASFTSSEPQRLRTE